MSRATFERERLTLSNATPKVEKQFQRALERVVESFSDEEDGQDGDAATITVKYQFTRGAEGHVEIVTSVSEKLPGLRPSKTPARLPNGGAHIFVDIEADQEPLFPRNATVTIIHED